MLDVSWTPSARWSILYYGTWSADVGESLHYDESAVLGQLMLTQSGTGPFDAAILCGVELPRDHSEGTGELCGLLLQWDTEHVQFNFNPLLDAYPKAQPREPTELVYQWQAKSLVRPGLELGAQGFGSIDHRVRRKRSVRIGRDFRSPSLNLILRK